MSLRWKSFERKLKRRVRAEIRASAGLRQEYKRLRRGRRWWNVRINPNTYRLVFWFLALNFLSVGLMAVEQVLAFIWLWTTAAALWRTVQLQSTLYFAAELNLFNHLPISDAEIFQVQWRKFLRGSVGPVLDFSVLYGALAYRLGAGWQSPLIGLLFGSLQGLFNIGIAASLLSIGFRRWLPMSALLLHVGAIGLLIFGNSLPVVVAWLSAAAFWIPPAGWIQYALGLSFSHGAASGWVPSLIAGTLLACYPLARRRLQRGYVLSEASFAQAFRSTATGEAAALRLKEYGEMFAQSPQDASASVKARTFLNQFDWRKAGLVERIVSRVLTEREKAIAEFLTAANPGWTKSFRTMVLAGITLLIAAKVFSLQLASGFGVIIFVAVFFLLGGGSQAWRGFGPAATVGLPPPLYIFYPLSFAELHRAIMKIMLVRYLLFLPLLAGGAYLFTRSLNLNTGLISTYGVKIILTGIAAQPVLAIMPFSASSNDSDRFRFAVPALGYGLVTMACGAGFVFIQDLLTATAIGLLGALLCWGAPWLYGRRFNQSKFDLLPSTRSTTSTSLTRG